MRLLLIEDDKNLHRIILRHLTEAGYAADGCLDGEEGLDYMKSMAYDCVILDWMLPRRDGISVLREARKSSCTAPVLMLTARDAITDRVAGLDAGADDYLVKPFDFDELLARVRALMRRGNETKQTVLELDDLKMDTSTHAVTRDEKTISLTSREYALLEYLLRNQGILQTRLQIADHVWNYDYDYDSNVVDVYIRYLRNKVDKGFKTPLIHTVRGFGYVMRIEP
ncbi:MAG TPA: response regulator transcription factor [Lachnospiraceae bacterium]|nr:response regulator transcription factor [Lachnospiraceae bacterium]